MSLQSRRDCPPTPPAAGAILIWLVLALVLAGVAAAAGMKYFLPSKKPAESSTITCTVTRGVFEHNVVERGEIESASNVDVRCQVKARNSTGTTIIEVVEEGTLVQKGDILVKLDATALEQERVEQKISRNTKEAAMIEAKNQYEAAKIAKKEYTEGTYHQEEQTVKGEILIAEENLRKARQYLTYSERLAARGYVTSQQLEGDAFAVAKAKSDLETATTKLRVLREYTKPKTLKQLESDIKSAEARWKSEQNSFELESTKLADLEEQIKLCTIRAPQAGQVLYANDRSFRGGGSDFVVEPGSLVRENQTILRLPDASQMQVKAKINESRVTLVQPEMPATVRLDALGDATFQGIVTRVNEYPEPGSWFSSQIKEYATFVRILNSPKRIRPGLTAEVTIQVDRVDDAVIVPVQALSEIKRRYYCAVQKGEGWEPREVEITATNSKFVMVASGVEPGEVLAMNPRELLEDQEVGAAQSPETVSGMPPVDAKVLSRARGPRHPTAN
jgi:multidrug efflux pump subunit AcrA (membrane-fusion protein)